MSPRSILLTCIFSFIVSSIPLAYVIFVHHPQAIIEVKEQAREQAETCAPEGIPTDVFDEKVAEAMAAAEAQREATAAAEAQRDELMKELGRFQRVNRELRKKIDESKKERSYSECEIELARATSGFEESYRRFEIVKGYFDKCKNQTTMLGKVLIDAEAEIKNLTKQLTTCNIINNKMEGERRMAERKNNPQQGNRTTTAAM